MRLCGYEISIFFLKTKETEQKKITGSFCLNMVDCVHELVFFPFWDPINMKY